jgi:DNA-binding MarR family transcriptional regulator
MPSETSTPHAPGSPAPASTVARDLRTDAGLASSLRMSVMRLGRRLRVERSGDDLTLNQLAVIGTLHRCGPLTPGELASIENVKPPSMTRIVDKLVESALVTRVPHPTDGRQVVVDLTDAARLVIENDRRRRDAWLAQRLGALTPEQRELLRRVAPILDELVGT